MLKKTVAQTVVLGAIVTTVCASSTLAHSPFYRSGFFAGAQVGASFGNGKFNSTFNPPAGAPQAASAASGSASKTAALFGLLAGYRHIFYQDFTVGLNLEANFLTNNELSKQLTHFSGATNQANVQNTLKKNYTVIPSVVFGKIFCSRWHAYIGLGLGIARFKEQASFVFTPPLQPNEATGSVSANQTRLGFVPSIGIEYAATPNVSIFGNLSYEIYGKVRKTFSNATVIGTNYSYQSSIRPSYLGLKAGVIYRF